jgi:L-Ala-D/L-Glu epimerase / N-acetyl-D-glutamate racemase
LDEKSSEGKHLRGARGSPLKPGPAIPASLEVAVEPWPIRGQFAISRGAKSVAEVVVARLGQGGRWGRGECVPYARYGETVAGVVAAIEGLRTALAQGVSRRRLQALLPAGAARNAIDCALWDLEAKQRGVSARALAGLPVLGPVETAFTLSLGAPEAMAAAAKAASHHPLLKLKLGGDGDETRLAAVRRAAPKARLIADANEAWTPGRIEALMAAAAAVGIELIEQPLPAAHDAKLAGIPHPVPVCADESAHDRRGLAALSRRYDAINIKLDKTGGLTEALATKAEAQRLGLKIMVGCMVATSLAMAPALLLAQDVDWVDLDGPLLLSSDRDPALLYEAGLVYPAEPALWG